ncbi:TRAP transporter small permease [Marinobacterium rhizophilum]|uniref:TRAP transporter small permease protein n=2 Tax=Marinobacterium rhizophilum TaxID=420402 RepID=A0ABY5HRE7_9GAMM|nr:TRAP transporter small permease [Marinobacterium rhizophilum]
MTLIILVSTLLRYLAGQPISFSDELAGLLFLTMAFSTFPHVLNKSGHISLDLLTERMSPGMRKICSLFSAAIFIAFAITFSYQAWGFMDFSRLISSRTDVSGILLWPWMALMPASMVLCIAVELKKQLFRTDCDTSGKTTL